MIDLLKTIGVNIQPNTPPSPAVKNSVSTVVVKEEKKVDEFKKTPDETKSKSNQKRNTVLIVLGVAAATVLAFILKNSSVAQKAESKCTALVLQKPKIIKVGESGRERRARLEVQKLAEKAAANNIRIHLSGDPNIPNRIEKLS